MPLISAQGMPSIEMQSDFMADSRCKENNLTQNYAYCLHSLLGLYVSPLEFLSTCTLVELSNYENFASVEPLEP